MQIAFMTRDLVLNPELKSFIERKVSALTRYVSDIRDARIELSTARSRSAGNHHVVQITLNVNGSLLRAQEKAPELRTAIDAALEKIRTQVTRFKERRIERPRGRNKASSILPEAEALEHGTDASIVRVKTFQTKPMSVDEAIAEMEMLGHSFFVFFDSSDRSPRVVYRRSDGGYGLIIPELT
jgi:putative sigma-54 modulation protein